MDADIFQWILEFLMRSSAVQDHVVKNILQVLPLSSAAAEDTRFKKAVLLRTIQSEVSNATVTETTLQALELIEEMDRNDGVEIGESLKAAYFAAAVEYTVKYLALEEGINGKYFEAVKRVWRGRIGNLEESGNRSELVRDNAELTRWKNDLEAALWDAKVAKRLMNLNTRVEALQKLRAFLGGAWALMGPSFIEAAAATRNGAGELAAEQEAAANEEDKLVAEKEHMEYVSAKPSTEENKNSDKFSSESEGEKLMRTSDIGLVASAKVNSMAAVHCNFGAEISGVPFEGSVTGGSELNATIGNTKSAENQSGKDINALNPSVDKSVAPQATDSGCGSQSCIPQSNSTQPSLMERNSTAHTYEWDDSINGSQERMTDRASKLHLPNPKRKIVSPLRKYKGKNFVRRTIKRWSLLEEDTLRTAVQKFGKGKWKLILNSHRDIFEERTEVDLKDKWRNMTQYLGSMDVDLGTSTDMGTTQ